MMRKVCPCGAGWLWSRRVFVFVSAALLISFLPACSDDSTGGDVGDASMVGDAVSAVDGGLNADGHLSDGAPSEDGGGKVDASVPARQWDPTDFDNVYEVGPGQQFDSPCDVPWETLGPSTLVRIHFRPEPYRCKWVINTEATETSPLVVVGIPDNGHLPVISGDNAVTRLELDYWNEERSVVKVGGSNLPTDSEIPSWIYIDRLEIRSGRPAYRFTDDRGDAATYSSNAAAIHIEVGEHIRVLGSVLTDCANGLFTTASTSDIVIAGNRIYGNGIEGSIYAHNSYTESLGILFEYNHYGPLRDGCEGNNLKDRSAGTVIRYNWIEGGNRQLDLVETDHDDLAQDPGYDETFVYGNILVEPDGAGNSQILHYGGDGGDRSRYRRGWLYFYHNTVVSTRSGYTTLMRLSTNDVHADVRDNIIYTTAGPGNLAILDARGNVDLISNWLSDGWVTTHEASLDGLLTEQDNLTGTEPGFQDGGAQDFHLVSGSPCVDHATALLSSEASYPVTQQYVQDASWEDRRDDGAPDIGAFER